VKSFRQFFTGRDRVVTPSVMSLNFVASTAEIVHFIHRFFSTPIPPGAQVTRSAQT
jgi:hypothetical protein